VGIDRTSKFAVTQLVDKADRKTAWEFLEHLLKAVPYRIHTILTNNGIQFAEQPRNRNTAYSRQMRFDMICEADLPPGRPSVITRVLGFDSRRFRVWQARRARRARIIQTPCVPRLGLCYRAKNAA
jgi:hypothetical protein